MSLSHAKKSVKNTKSPTVVEEIAIVYVDLGKLLERHGRGTEAQTNYKKAQKLSVFQSSTPGKVSLSVGVFQDAGSVHPSPPVQSKQTNNAITIPEHIFVENLRPPSIKFKLPEADERLASTPQLACCLGLLQASHSPDIILEPTAQSWLRVIEKDVDELNRLRTMATEVIRAFKRDEIKDAKAVAEVVYLAPVLSKDAFQDLLSEFYSGIDHSGLLKFHQLEGLAQLIQSADPGYLNADDLVKILGLLSNRLRDTHQQSTQHMHQLTLAVTHVLDAMTDTKVTGLDREKLHEPLSSYLSELKGSSDPYLVFQAAYAYQALLCVPDNETTWQAAMRRTGKVIQGLSGLVSAVKGLDLIMFIEGLGDIQKGFEGVSKVAEIVATAYDNVTTLAQSGQSFVDSLKEGLSFERKRDWYSALRGADVMIRDGELATFKELVYRAPCRRDPAFQWGVCLRLGEIAVNPVWDANTRRSAISFLGEIYREDGVWGQHSSIKQWILNILMQASSLSTNGLEYAETLLRELEMSGDGKKQDLYRMSRQRGPISYPLKIAIPELATPSLLDRVQSRPDVEGSLRLLRKRRTKERGNAVYIQPQAKASLQAADDTRFPLMEKVKGFLDSDQKVFLLLGDSGAGKSTFSRELEFELWQSYKNKSGRIPLLVNLPAIDKPEHDMIAKQLRKAEFSEPQIREMKHYRRFILICDGYDESQQTHNLYMSNRLNQTGEWDAQMIISCRSEYLGIDYRDRFQPGDRNKRSDSSLFQEAVITSFTLDQVQAYIHQYVSVHQPLWQAEDYKQALELIPSLKELVKNPFLMTLSLEVLPRMVDPGQHLSATQVTRVGLYDHFVEQWLERGKKRLGEKDLSPQARAAFESLSDEGFTRNGIEYMKKLAVAIYKEQGGHPIVEYSRLVDEGSWKDAFYLREDKQLLREACPLTRNGDQHRFIHRSLLEYGLARAIFDPQDRRKRTASAHIMGRRGSVSSTLSVESDDTMEEEDVAVLDQEPDIGSPLVWRRFMHDHSLLHFLEERVHQEPVFKDQLLAYIEHSKKDKKWRKAAANAITILVRAGVQFIGADLKGIRISRADLSYGVFDSAQMQDADLRKVNLRGVWLRQTDLSRSQMSGAQFGELPLLAEDNKVRACAYSPDGNSLALGLHNGDISVYAIPNWEKVMTLKGHSSMVRRVAYSPKGDQLASASVDKTARIWDAGTGSLLHVLSDHGRFVHSVAYSPQGDQVASGGSDKAIRLWNPATGECLQVLSGHTRGVHCATYSPKGTHIASGSTDSTVRLWNVESGDCIRTLSGHGDWVWEVAFSPQGDQIASASVDNMIRTWDIDTGACRHLLSGHSSEVYTVVYSPRGDQIATGSVDGTLKLWDVEAGFCRHTLTGHSGPVSCVAYSPKGDQIASGSFDKTARLWDVSVVASRHVSSGHGAGVLSVKCSPKGDQIASGSLDNTVRLWDVEIGACRQILRGHEKTVFSVAYSPRGDMIASGSGDKSIRLWDVETGECRYTLTGHNHWVKCVVYSPQGDLVASGSGDKTGRLWDMATGDCRGVLEGHTDGITCIAFSPNGKQIATGSADQTIRLWDVETAACCQTLEGHSDWVKDIMYSPEGDQLASAGGGDKTVRIWNVETGDCQLTLTDHSDLVDCVAYAPNGLLASGGQDKTVRLWNTSSGQCRAAIQNFQGEVRSIVWSTIPDAHYLVTGCADGSILKWQVFEEVEEEDQCRVQLCWSATNGTLAMMGATIQDARGLSQLNTSLLKQRGAVGEPEHVLREASNKLITMASVVSKIRRPPAEPAMDTSVAADLAEEQLEQQE
ncbi:hypothetical protein BGX34_009133 [Mortierella sp. NVP85]|nr:hypothetical protein BGX34_009133 [Mortierella sp. NVP85]